MACSSGNHYISEEDFVKENLHFDNGYWEGWLVSWHPDNGYYNIYYSRDSSQRSTIIIFKKQKEIGFRIFNSEESEFYTKETLNTSELLKRDYPEITSDDLIRRADWLYKYYIRLLSSNKRGNYETGTIFIQSINFSVYKEPCDITQPDSILLKKWHHSDILYHN